MAISSGGGVRKRLPKPTTRWVISGLALALILGAITLDSWLKMRMEVITIRVGDVPLTVELANDPVARARGLKYRKALAHNAGMLFVFPKAERQKFWMKNTPIDLDIGFFDGDARLLEIREMAALDEQTHYVSSGPAKYALEVNRGWYSSNRIPANALLWLPASLHAR